MSGSRTKAYQLNKTKFLSPDEKALTLENVKSAPLRDRLLIELPLYSGGRASEILALRPMDLDHEERAIELIGLKGSMDRLIPLPDDLFDRLVDFALGDPDKPIFRIGYRQYLNLWEQYAPKTIKAARHTFAIGLYQRTKDLRLVQRALGHRSITNTMIYADYGYTASEMRKAMEE